MLLPLLLLSTVVFGLPGAALALRLFAESLSLSAGLGALMLMGLVINTGIVLFATYRRRGTDGGAASATRRWTTLVIVSRDRLRAVLATALSTGAALLPVAVLGGAHGGLAAVVVGGIASATLYGLLVLPLAYGALGSRRQPDWPRRLPGA